MVAREGIPFILIGFAVLAIALVALVMRPGGVTVGIAAVCAVLAIWVVWFFRDPERTGPRGDTVVIAPADGRIVQVMEVDEPTFMGGRAIRIAIFMNVFNVHVNRYPVTGKVVYRHYNPGLFINAAEDKASLDNEQASVGIEAGTRKVLVRQIAGLIARRIVTYSKVGDAATQGDRFGIIRFGSRVDVYLPLGSVPKVKVGELTSAGTTVLAEFR
jgi:phosphatidylserine decarboxylase